MLSGKWINTNSHLYTPTAKTDKTPLKSHSPPSIVSSVSGGLYIKTTQDTLFHAMHSAIQTVAVEYSKLKSDHVLNQAEVQSLDQLNLKSIEDIKAWEQGWIKLINSVLGFRKVTG